MSPLPLAKNVKHDLPNCGFAAALRLAHQYNNDLGMAVWVLNRPSEPSHKIFEFDFVALAYDLPNMPKQPSLFLIAPSWCFSEPSKKIVLVGMYLLRRLKDNRVCAATGMS